MEDIIQNEIKKLGKLKQYKDASEEVLTKIAQKNVTLRELVDNGNFIDEIEKKLAKKIFEAYLAQNDFESYSDLSTLSMLVFNEVLSNRVQKSINECTTKDGKSYISDKLLKAHTDLINEILKLKIKLGIDAEKKDDEFSAFQLLKKRFNTHINENKNEFTLAVPYTCSDCGKEDVKMCLVRRRVKDFDVIDHPMYMGRFYYNQVAMNLVKENILSKEQYAKIFQVSTYFVDYCLKNEGKIIKK